jgi:hypothetical protein
MVDGGCLLFFAAMIVYYQKVHFRNTGSEHAPTL